MDKASRQRHALERRGGWRVVARASAPVATIRELRVSLFTSPP